jgi:2-keto-4-pentenoate hydratase/2-oxohepta-3-ene-1,7-dioic acid hydratase in catechol pathway
MPDDTVLIPRGSAKTDYEIELAVVIGATARYLESPAEADAGIAAYAITDDVTERAFQHERGAQWDKGKSCKTFNPLGPWLVTPDEAGEPQSLIVWYLSQFMVLAPGDLINTGTPAGVAFGANGFSYLREGDVVELEINRLGSQRHVLGQA